MCYLGDVVFITALNQAVHVDVRCGHIDIPPGDIARSRLGAVASRRIRCGGLCIRIRCAQAKIVFHCTGKTFQILLRIAVDVDDTLFVILGDGAVGCNEGYRVPLHACGTIHGSAADADIPADIVNGHIAVEVANLTVYLHIGDGGIGQFAVTNPLLTLFLFRSRQVAVINLIL